MKILVIMILKNIIVDISLVKLHVECHGNKHKHLVLILSLIIFHDYINSDSDYV